MPSHRGRKGQWLAAFVLLAAFGLPRGAHGAVCGGAFDIVQKGFCSTTTNQGCDTAVDCPVGETCQTFNFFDPGDPKGNGGNQLRVNLAIGAGTITTGTPPQLTVNRVRFDLDCVANSGFPCTDQGPVVQYGGDATITTTCAGVTWASSTEQGGNEIVFNASQPIVIPQNCSPRSGVPCGNCELEFTILVQSQEPSGSDATPQVVEEVAGYINGTADASCSATLQSGASQTADVPICPSCTIDQCNLGCDQTTGTCTPEQASTPCADTDGNSCTTAGCELNASSVGVCVQTHLFAENSTPCADTDGNACTTAGCDGQGVCDQNHNAKVCPPADQCNGVCDTTSGKCTPKVSDPCTDTDGNTCTTAGCELSPTDPELGVCVQTHMFASDSTPCPDTDNNVCTTAGCDGQGVCDQNHMLCPACSLEVQKTACVVTPTVSANCTGGAVALRLQYTGPDISGPTTVNVAGNSGVSVTYDLPGGLVNGDILSMASENGFTIDATAHGQSKLGSRTTVTINGTTEVLHTSCSCRANPATNLKVCNPMCLDASSPDNATRFKGAPSPLWTLVGLKDPRLGDLECGQTSGQTSEECQTDLPAAGADVNYTYKITNTGTTTANNVTVEDDKLGTVPGSPIASIGPGEMVTLVAKQFLTGTTLNTVTVTGNNGFCEATAKAAIVAPCELGYPFTSNDPRTSVVFNESEVLRAFQPATAGPGQRLMVFYNDEHALTLGVRRVLVKSSSGTSSKDFPSFSQLTTSPDSVVNPDVGTMALDGDEAGTDTSSCAGFPDLCDRPLFPALFITDITDDPNSRAGDWQSGGTPIAPNAVFGTWKGAVRTVDKTKNPPVVSVTPDRDPAKNHYNLDGGDAAPAGLVDQGFGAEIVWDVDTLLAAGVIQEGRVYRVQFMVHDGDQNKSGGDTGQGCATVFLK